MLFSERLGLVPAKAIQIRSVDQSLKNRLHNLVYRLFDSNIGLDKEEVLRYVTDRLGEDSTYSLKNEAIFEQYLVDEDNAQRWYVTYDLIELFIRGVESANAIRPLKCNSEEFIEELLPELINRVLEEEKSGYRMVNGLFVPITSEEELVSIAESCHTPLDSINQHMKKALALFADRKVPDYENSIKESITAVEAMCCTITNDPKATLGEAIKKLTGAGIEIHGAMISAFEKLYGYASDTDGIRHGGMDFKNAPAEDAKFMLVACSAFINYLTEKYAKIQKAD